MIISARAKPHGRILRQFRRCQVCSSYFKAASKLRRKDEDSNKAPMDFVFFAMLSASAPSPPHLRLVCQNVSSRQTRPHLPHHICISCFQVALRTNPKTLERHLHDRISPSGLPVTFHYQGHKTKALKKWLPRRHWYIFVFPPLSVFFPPRLHVRPSLGAKQPSRND